jgi:two-component system, NarL family, response regulator
MIPKLPDAISVLVVDDHPIVREGIAAMVDQQPDLRVVAECANGIDAFAEWRRLRPQVTLLDLEMGAHGGIETLIAIREEDPAARVIVLTTYDLEEDIYRCVQAGACAYLLKDIPRRELLDAVRRVHRGEKVLPPAVTAKLAERLSGEQATPRELEVLGVLALGLANKQIAEQLGVAEATVKTHVNGLMQKLGAASRTEAVTRARAKGWLRK